jgi:hypothetical protein
MATSLTTASERARLHVTDRLQRQSLAADLAPRTDVPPLNEAMVLNLLL